MFSCTVGREGHCKQVILACARSVSATLGLPPLSACVLSCIYCLGSRLLCRELSEAGPGLHVPPRSKPLRFRHSGSSQRCRLGWACVLCPSQVQAAQVTRCLVSTVAVTYRPPPSLPLGLLGVQLAHLLRRKSTVRLKKSWLATKPACSLVDDASLGL